jgi:O-methyltransferase involved in polyketide biosynthesis
MLRAFEVDRPGPQVLEAAAPDPSSASASRSGCGLPVDFEAGVSWWERLQTAGFDAGQPMVAASTGVIVYLTRDATAATLRHVAALAATFMPPLSLIEPEERAPREATERFARAAGTPLISFFAPEEMLAMTPKAGFRDVRHVSAASLTERYFAGRTDGVRPSSSEELLVATT